MNLTIDLSIILWSLGGLGLILIVWFLYKYKTFRNTMIIITIITVMILMTIIIPSWGIISETKSREMHQGLLPKEEQDLYKYVKWYEQMLLKIVPYKELKDRYREKELAKERYIQGN